MHRGLVDRLLAQKTDAGEHEYTQSSVKLLRNHTTDVQGIHLKGSQARDMWVAYLLGSPLLSAYYSQMQLDY